MFQPKSKKITLILGDQLYENHPCLKIDSDYVMLESKDFNHKFKYHKTRIQHCFVSMREYEDYLKNLNRNVLYYKYEENIGLVGLFQNLKSLNYNTVYIAFVEGKYFSRLIGDLAQKNALELIIQPDDQKFLTSQEEWLDFRKVYSKRLFMNDFYIYQRKRLGLFVDLQGKSTFGDWSLDKDNRQKIPKEMQISKRETKYESKHLLDVNELIQKEFAGNFGELQQELFSPVNHTEAKEHLTNFFEHYLANFGPFEDAISTKDSFLFHSLVSSLLNSGLLTPSYVLESLIHYLDQNPHIPNSSVEGFVRQIIGWREWVRALYWNEYEENLAQYNFFEAKNKLPNYFWDKAKLENIKVNTPLYESFLSVWNYGYCHHIQRLMVIGNWMTLNEYDPIECYDWFMTAFIDSYEWVMVANVFGMGLFADGGKFATKPYSAGGNYLKKMSDYKDSKNWENIWTDKFWSFLLKHEQFFVTNPRLKMLIDGRKKKEKLM